jgi:hypothetical protein
MPKFAYEENNVHFDAFSIRDDTVWVFGAKRISDDHRLPGQQFFAKIDEEDMPELAQAWFEDNPGLSAEPDPTLCFRCGAVLLSDADTNYQFNNALWVAFHAGYAMFTDSIAGFPTNTEDQWLRDATGEPITYLGCLVDNPAYVPEYEEERILPGRPDAEFVLCHDCAHELTDFLRIPKDEVSKWHSHRQEYTDAHPDHFGWDYDMKRERANE